MRVVHVNTVFGRGGAARHAQRLIEAERRAGIASRMLVAASYAQADYVDTLSVTKLADRDYGLLDHNVSPGGAFVSHSWIEAADIVHLHNAHGGYLHPHDVGALARRKPLVWTLHDMNAYSGRCMNSLGCARWQIGCGQCPHPDAPPVSLPDRSDETWAFKADIAATTDMTIVAPSRWQADNVRRSMLRRHPLAVIPTGVDLALFKPLMPSRRSGHIVGVVAERGILSRLKFGIDLHVFADMLARVLPDVNVVVLGGDSDHRDGVVTHAKRVITDSAMAAQLQRFTVLVSLSQAENYPLSILEAQASGVPVVAFDVGGIKEIVVDGETGYIVRPADGEALAQRTLALLKDGFLNRRFALAARQRMRAIADESQWQAAYEAIYATLCP